MTASRNAQDSIATIIPTLRYRDVLAAIDWLCNTFGFETLLVVAGKNGSIAHAQLIFGNGMVMLGSARDSGFDQLQKSPNDAGGINIQSPYVVVADADEQNRWGLEARAEVVYEIEDQPHSDRLFSCRDPEGHLRKFSTYDPWSKRPD